ncbi:hypothetical protein CEXT_216541 [Caerostris extrusa]|uniref:Uncharacterized protein n=1 Tax=Caerostris extrusa TaxID=172846 RepID=A0AAV4QQC5_CAEEX|nr:hypothetical protein CEXT_216541 [Caerostris extrusa]
MNFNFNRKKWILVLKNESSLHLDANPCDILSGFMAEERPITIDEACALRHLLLEAGPCGVLAGVQAHVILELLFGVSHIDTNSGISKLKPAEKKKH